MANKTKVVNVIELRETIDNSIDQHRKYDISGNLSLNYGQFSDITSGLVQKDGKQIASFRVNNSRISLDNMPLDGDESNDIMNAIFEFVDNVKEEQTEKNESINPEIDG